MTEREQMVRLSAFSVAVLAFAGSWGLVTRPKPVETVEAAPAPVVLAATSPALVATAPAPAARVATAPAPGLTRATAPTRRVVVVRRSRAS